MKNKFKKISSSKEKVEEVSKVKKKTKGGIICEVCNKRLRSRYHLKIHTTVHTGEKNYKCEICKKGFQQKWNLVTHVARVHSKEKPFKCNDCGKAYGYSSHFKRHVKTHFLEKIEAPDLVKKRILNPFKCEFCEKSFESNYRLELHTRTHTGTKPYICDKCGKRFTNKRFCALHVQKKHLSPAVSQQCTEEPTPNSDIFNGTQKVLSENEQFQNFLTKKELILCEVCGKSISRGSLKKHLNIHYRNRIYSCCYCKKIFLESSQRLVHERKHTGEKPYTCDVCGREHTQYGNLLTHRKRYHNLTEKDELLWKRNKKAQQIKEIPSEIENASISIAEPSESNSTTKYTGNETIEEFLKKASSWANKRFQESKNISLETKNELESYCSTDENEEDPLEIEDSETENEMNKEKIVIEENKNSSILEIKQKINRKIYEKLVEELKKSSIKAKVLQVVEKIDNSKNQDVLREFLKKIKNLPNNVVMRKHNDMMFWHCWICESKLKSRHLLARHLFIHEPEENRPFKCDICQKTFTQSNNFKEHVMSHSKENQYYCEKCGSGFRHKSHFNIHMKRHDPITAEPLLKKFECSFCGKKMRTNYQKTEHERTHTKEKPFLCKICGQQFGASSTLNRHQSTHVNASHQCKICFKYFRQKSNLKRHYDTHSQYPYTRFSCDCGKSFSQNPSLKKHKMICKNRVEPVVKPFGCLICSKRFLTKSDLKRHTATHDTEKKFKCSVCSTMLKSRDTFKIHMKRHSDLYKKNTNEQLSVEDKQ